MVMNLYSHDYSDKLYSNVYAVRKAASAYARKNKRAFLHTDLAITVYHETPWNKYIEGFVGLNSAGNPVWCEGNRHVFSHLIKKDGSIRKITSPFQL